MKTYVLVHRTVHFRMWQILAKKGNDPSGIVLLRFINYLYFVHVKYSILSMECNRIFSRFLGIIDEPVQWIIKWPAYFLRLL